MRQHLQHNSDHDEIIFDVEQRMAELLKDRTANREVIMHQDVLYLIEVLGKPEQYVEDEEADKATNAATEATAKAFSTNKPLYRDIDDRKIGGVLSGMAHYFNISPTMLRHRLCSVSYTFLCGLATGGSSFSMALVGL